jgi:hypothetical protein
MAHTDAAMTANEWRRLLHLTQRTIGDVDAARRGRIGKRVYNRALGRIANRILSRLWAR